MPIVDDEVISRLLTDRSIMALTVDTNIFDEKGLQLNSPTFKAIVGLRKNPFSFILSGTVAKEVQTHLVKKRKMHLGVQNAK